jgi:hypothetical protein
VSTTTATTAPELLSLAAALSLETRYRAWRAGQGRELTPGEEADLGIWALLWAWHGDGVTVPLDYDLDPFEEENP